MPTPLAHNIRPNRTPQSYHTGHMGCLKCEDGGERIPWDEVLSLEVPDRDQDRPAKPTCFFTSARPQPVRSPNQCASPTSAQPQPVRGPNQCRLRVKPPGGGTTELGGKKKGKARLTMMLFIFAAIIFTMASTTVIEDMCENGGRSVCAWKGMGKMCSCPDPYSCVQSDAYKAEVTLVNRTETFYTCQQISSFSLCAASDRAMQGQLQQLNCRCSNGIYVLGVGAIVCG